MAINKKGWVWIDCPTCKDGRYGKIRTCPLCKGKKKIKVSTDEDGKVR